jgi:hypothetical protein
VAVNLNDYLIPSFVRTGLTKNEEILYLSLYGVTKDPSTWSADTLAMFYLTVGTDLAILQWAKTYLDFQKKMDGRTEVLRFSTLYARSIKPVQ